KSTLLLQVASALSSSAAPALLATAEESVQQIGLRAVRLGSSDVNVLAENEVGTIIEHSVAARPSVLIVDSIQTVMSSNTAGVPGGINQVRESASRLVRHAKDSGSALILVGHVTKDGAIAGPKQLEHLVDVVLSLEGEPSLGLRVLRSQKNRFGATHQVGLFEMTEQGLVELQKPLLGDWSGEVPGTVAFAGVEGRRSVLVEVQALVSASSGPQPRRSVKGVSVARVHQLLAVLERHAGLSFAGLDVFVNISGGLRITEPAADLPIALALVSSLLDRPLGRVAAWGEVGLTGEVRKASQAERRLQEVERLGLMVVASGRSRTRIEGLLLAAGLVPGVAGPVVASGGDDRSHALSVIGDSAAFGSRD
ncbi:MAG: DNA repair protein RadA, partial [Acidimicrobiia bacterium]